MPEAERQKIADEYYETLEKPAAAKHKPLFCLCIIGLVGAGKSTVQNRLRESIPMVRLSGDEVRKLMFEKGMPSYDAVTMGDIGSRVGNRLKKEGYCVAHDNDFGHPEVRAKLHDTNRRLGVREIWIRIAPPEDFILNNNRQRNQIRYLFKDADEAVATYYRRKALHEQEAVALDALPYAYTFDTSLPNFDQQVADAVAAIKRQLAIK